MSQQRKCPHCNGTGMVAPARAKARAATLEEVRLCVAKAGLPDSDAVWFWNKCEGNGWTNGGKPIKSWQHTIAAWSAANYMPSQKFNGHTAPKPSEDWKQCL